MLPTLDLRGAGGAAQHHAASLRASGGGSSRGSTPTSDEDRSNRAELLAVRARKARLRREIVSHQAAISRQLANDLSAQAALHVRATRSRSLTTMAAAAGAARGGGHQQQRQEQGSRGVWKGSRRSSRTGRPPSRSLLPRPATVEGKLPGASRRREKAAAGFGTTARSVLSGSSSKIGHRVETLSSGLSQAVLAAYGVRSPGDSSPTNTSYVDA